MEFASGSDIRIENEDGRTLLECGEGGVLSLGFEVGEASSGERVDRVLMRQLELLAENVENLQMRAVTRSKLHRWIDAGLVLIDGAVCQKSGQKLRAGEEVLLSVPAQEEVRLVPDSSVALDILFEDDSILVVNKPAGLVVHPGAGNWTGTLAHGLAAYLDSEARRIGEAHRPGLVHRLDKDTSGILLVTKTETAYQHLIEQFRSREISREYLALVTRLPKVRGRIEAPIGRHPKDRKKMAVVAEGGRYAATDWAVEKELRAGFLLRLKLLTGRTHQIRVHLAWARSGIVGDPNYPPPPDTIVRELRGAAQAFGRQALHAERLSFVHPQSNESMTLEAPMPQEMLKLLERFR